MIVRETMKLISEKELREKEHTKHPIHSEKEMREREREHTKYRNGSAVGHSS